MHIAWYQWIFPLLPLLGIAFLIWLIREVKLARTTTTGSGVQASVKTTIEVVSGDGGTPPVVTITGANTATINYISTERIVIDISNPQK